jgi:tetrahydromethanopterin S-methyltransferase subunit B
MKKFYQMDPQIPPLDSYPNDHNHSSCGYFKVFRSRSRTPSAPN